MMKHSSLSLKGGRNRTRGNMHKIQQQKYVRGSVARFGNILPIWGYFLMAQAIFLENIAQKWQPFIFWTVKLSYDANILSIWATFIIHWATFFNHLVTLVRGIQSAQVVAKCPNFNRKLR